MTYKRLNDITGWLIFAVALTVYTLTLEPTVSFWDCGEFISACYKMQVVHPPGAPLFIMIGRLFTLFAGDPSKVAYMVNFMNGLCSAFTILFLYWTITAIARKALEKRGELTSGATFAILGSGIVGALCYTFTDSFWFSAVEGEVYAMSSFFTAIVFWTILKWDRAADEPDAHRWLILIAYLMGLSIGVHLLNLLAIPAIGYVYYFRKYKATRSGFIWAGIISIFILGFVQFLLIPGIPKITAYFDLAAVNGFGMPFGMGAIIGLLVIVSALIVGLKITRKRGLVALNTSILGIVFILVGYSSYFFLVIRSNSNPVIDMNDPEDPYSLLSYLNRDQYGSVPVFYGPYFTAEMVDQKEGPMKYYKDRVNNKYAEAGRDVTPVYDPKQSTILPRMFNRPGMEQRKKDFYKSWENIPDGKKPSFAKNLDFLFSYQLGHMYGRYFMWNFSGRQNDIQGHGHDPENGNWITGFSFIDNPRLGDQDSLPHSLQDNKAKNKYYMLPFLLGLLGMAWQYRNHKQGLTIVGFLFFFTGIAINLYLNPDPLQPRERDYAYAGSFYAFAIWVGLGVLLIWDFLSKKMNQVLGAMLSTLACTAAVPALMASQNWDDHDRSEKFTARDFAIDYLESCAPNAILFTMGDNDTYPLWYAQEVEGIRTDVRIVNLSLLGTDWYINQQRRAVNNAEALPFTIGEEKIVQGIRDYVPFFDKNIAGFTNLKDVMDFVSTDNEAAKVPVSSGEMINYLPTKKFSIPVNKAEILASKTVALKDSQFVVPRVEFELNRNGVYKNDLMVLDLIANNNWKRPIYFTVSMPSESYLGMQDYLQMEGLVYRLVPIKNPPMQGGEIGRVEEEVMYNNFVNKFKWGNIETGKIYLDPESNRMTLNLRSGALRLAEALLQSDKKAKTITLLDYMQEKMPGKYVPMNVLNFRFVEMYYYAGAPEKAKKLSEELHTMYEDDARYYLGLPAKFRNFYERDMQNSIAIMQEIQRLAKTNGLEDFAKKLEARMKAIPNFPM